MGVLTTKGAPGHSTSVLRFRMIRSLVPWKFFVILWPKNVQIMFRHWFEVRMLDGCLLRVDRIDRMLHTASL